MNDLMQGNNTTTNTNNNSMVWGAQDAWRSHPCLVPKGPWQFAPGLSKALIAFGAFVVVEKAVGFFNNKKNDDAHGHGGDDAHGHGGDDAHGADGHH